MERARALWRLVVPYGCLASIVLLSGCATFGGYPERTPPPANDLQILEPLINAAAITACLKAPTDACRNQIVGARIYATDLEFSQFEEKLFKQARAGGYAATLTTMGLTAGAAVAGGGTSQVLSGIATLIVGGREAFEKEVLAEKTVLAIHTEMRARRTDVMLRLRIGLLQSITQYPLSIALSDLSDYYTAGTVLGALIGITESAGVNSRAAETRLRETFSWKPDQAAKNIRLAVCGDLKECSKPNMDVFRRMREQCFAKVGLPQDTLVLDLVGQESLARERALVASCMGLQ